MFDYEFITVRSMDGSNRAQRAIEVFDCVTGKAVAICRRRPFEKRNAWIERAMDPERIALFA